MSKQLIQQDDIARATEVQAILSEILSICKSKQSDPAQPLIMSTYVAQYNRASAAYPEIQKKIYIDDYLLFMERKIQNKSLLFDIDHDLLAIVAFAKRVGGRDLQKGLDKLSKDFIKYTETLIDFDPAQALEPYSVVMAKLSELQKEQFKAAILYYTLKNEASGAKQFAEKIRASQLSAGNKAKIQRLLDNEYRKFLKIRFKSVGVIKEYYSEEQQPATPSSEFVDAKDLAVEPARKKKQKITSRFSFRDAAVGVGAATMPAAIIMMTAAMSGTLAATIIAPIAILGFMQAHKQYLKDKNFSFDYKKPIKLTREFYMSMAAFVGMAAPQAVDKPNPMVTLGGALVGISSVFAISHVAKIFKNKADKGAVYDETLPDPEELIDDPKLLALPEEDAKKKSTDSKGFIAPKEPVVHDNDVLAITLGNTIKFGTFLSHHKKSAMGAIALGLIGFGGLKLYNVANDYWVDKRISEAVFASNEDTIYQNLCNEETLTDLYQMQSPVYQEAIDVCERGIAYQAALSDQAETQQQQVQILDRKTQEINDEFDRIAEHYARTTEDFRLVQDELCTGLYKKTGNGLELREKRFGAGKQQDLAHFLGC